MTLRWCLLFIALGYVAAALLAHSVPSYAELIDETQYCCSPVRDVDGRLVEGAQCGVAR